MSSSEIQVSLRGKVLDTSKKLEYVSYTTKIASDNDIVKGIV